jgi:hypothetical protein
MVMWPLLNVFPTKVEERGLASGRRPSDDPLKLAAGTMPDADDNIVVDSVALETNDREEL